MVRCEPTATWGNISPSRAQGRSLHHELLTETEGTRLSARTTPRLSRAAEMPPPSLEKPSWLLFRWEGSVGTGMWAACSRIAGKGAAGWWEGCVPLQEAVPSCGLSKKAQGSGKEERWPSPPLPSPRITWGSGMGGCVLSPRKGRHTHTNPAQGHLNPTGIT